MLVNTCLPLQRGIQIPPYYLVCVFGGYNAPSDWLILRHYPPTMRTGRLRLQISHTINNLLTSNVQSLRENPQPRLFCVNLAIAR